MSMPSPIAEQQYGRYDNQMVFSPITTCTTLICSMSASPRLMGAHFVLVRGNEPDYAAVLNGMNVLKGTDTIARMYIVRVEGIWDAIPNDADYAPTDFLAASQPATFRRALGFNGEVWVLETEGKGENVSVSDTGAGPRVSVNGQVVDDDRFRIDYPPAAAPRRNPILRLFGKIFCCCCTGDPDA